MFEGTVVEVVHFKVEVVHFNMLIVVVHCQSVPMALSAASVPARSATNDGTVMTMPWTVAESVGISNRIAVTLSFTVHSGGRDGIAAQSSLSIPFRSDDSSSMQLMYIEVAVLLANVAFDLDISS